MFWSENSTGRTTQTFTWHETQATAVCYSNGEAAREIVEAAIEGNMLPRPAQLEEIARLSHVGRRVTSPCEGARHGFQDAPRRPCYRARRTR